MSQRQTQHLRTRRPIRLMFAFGKVTCSAHGTASHLSSTKGLDPEIAFGCGSFAFVLVEHSSSVIYFVLCRQTLR